MTTIKALAERIIETYKSERLSGFREVSPEYMLATAVLSLWKNSERLAKALRAAEKEIQLYDERFPVASRTPGVKRIVDEALAAHEKLMGELSK